MRTLEIEYPDELLEAMDETERSFQTLAREVLVVKLYELGRISSGLAAQVLGISRREFLDLLGRYHVSFLDETSGATVMDEAQRG